MLSAIGNIIGGGANVFAGLTQGTAECGARPLFVGKQRNKYNDCIRQAQQTEKQKAQAKAATMKRIALVIGVIVVVAIITVLIIKRK